MHKYELSPEQQARTTALEAEFEQQLERVGVDMRVAHSQLRATTPPVERRISNDRSEVTFTIDASGIVETLRQLPDRAGTDAFVAAYNARG
jgi:hypothetical protein